MSTYVTTGFVLGSRPWREADRLYTLFTDTTGKVEAIAAGSRKMFSKLSPQLPPFAEVEVMIAHGRLHDRLASANIREAYLKPPYALPNLILASALMEIAAAVTRVGEPENRLIELLRETLRKINKLETARSDWRQQARVIFADFIIEILKLIGLAVTLTHCEQCRGELVEPTVFSWTNHGFFHKDHAPVGDTLMSLDKETLVWLAVATSSEARANHALPPSALAFLTDYLIGHTGRQLYTIKVLRSIL